MPMAVSLRVEPSTLMGSLYKFTFISSFSLPHSLTYWVICLLCRPILLARELVMMVWLEPLSSRQLVTRPWDQVKL